MQNAIKFFLVITLLIGISLFGEENHPKVKICLNMIVKNESQIIERCLNSVKNIVDCISICDTGSTDNTIEIIEQFMQKNHIPGKVHRHSWNNFGHNRSLSFTAAHQTLQELNFPLSSTYLLLLDADMVLNPQPLFNKQTLNADSYLVQQQNDWMSYYNIRLIRASLPWKCVGVTHEYWSCKQTKAPVQLYTLHIKDLEDGGCKADKYERDVKLLTEGLKDEPRNSRYMFYLAQSYKCLKNFSEAIKWYQARIDLNGWKEEVWYSKLMIGEAYEEVGSWNQALQWYLDAYQSNPERAEPLQKIATYYRKAGLHHLAYLFAKQGLRIPFPKDQILFISHPAYHYQFDEELSIVAYYNPSYRNEGFEAADRLILKQNVPEGIKGQTYKNLLFYVQNIKNEGVKPIEFERPFLSDGSTEQFYPTNSTIQKSADGYDVICKTVNYSQERGVIFKSRDKDDIIRTRNFLLHYDRDFNLLSQKEIVEDLPRKKTIWTKKISGIEDCRSIALDNHYWFTAATYDTHSTIGQSLCKLADNAFDNLIHVEKILPLQGPDPYRCEKNWLPFMKDQKLYIIYGYDPLIIYKVDRENGNSEIVYQKQYPYDFSHLRGSAAPIEFDDGYLLLTHEVVQDESQRHYLHRFLYLDKDLNIEKLSKPFTLLHLGVEYSCGMTLDHSGKKCIITASYEEQKANLIFVNVDTIRSLLRPLSSLSL